MPLALCHHVPRDSLLQYCLLFLAVAFALQAAMIGQRHHMGGGGSVTAIFTTSSGTGASAVTSKVKIDKVVQINALPAIYGSDGDTKVCNPSSSTLTYDCSRFGESMHAVIGLHIASFIINVFAIFIDMFGVVSFSKTTTLIVVRFWATVIPAIVLSIAELGLFYSRSVHFMKNVAAESIRANPPTFASGTIVGFTVHFKRGVLTNLLIASTVMMMVAFLLCTIRLALVCLVRKHLKMKSVQDKNINEVMELHMVNDDWQRQQQVLRSHIRSVMLEKKLAEDKARLLQEPVSPICPNYSPSSQSSSSSSSSSGSSIHFDKSEKSKNKSKNIGNGNGRKHSKRSSSQDSSVFNESARSPANEPDRI